MALIKRGGYRYEGDLVLSSAEPPTSWRVQKAPPIQEAIKEGGSGEMALMKEGGYPLEAGNSQNPYGRERIEGLYQKAGRAFAERVVVFHGGNEQYAAHWFYTCRMPSFENKTPAELVKEGRIGELEKLIGKL